MKSSDSLMDLIKRHGMEPTGDMEKDLEIAKKFMPKPYKKTGRTTKNKK